ncbi:hypothetical protein CN233_14755 [Sinorhizobium meliloti]|uniref:DUF680 domain-containing protein n=1 Tax=Rhizobium meliloti TaxID=382 RepID=A0AAW9TEE4_RHIML|nr:hypothetical protein [Sinorhizobium meliloti]MDX0999923.1 hypothetical protein [Sinorhizobium medicae]MQW31881.1 hypothetical protein [Sinorhizobium meliloti]QPI29091.1 hypothetical protein I0J99_30555 [Sinorhizobium meliloti]RVG31811.1 hypothetical protein CN233_14755 [Sinorhizobium meliloti]RVK97389.1 hypothetical protein CN152_18015 [Sinorhizobium meliloti]
MKIVIASLAFSLISAPVFAMCVGTDTFSSCSDASGNNYSVTRTGNTTFMNGTNTHTGSNWSQTSTTIGNSTFHNGIDKDGEGWSSTCINGFCN